MLLAIIGLVLAVGGLAFWVYPRISLEPGESLDPLRPFKAPFLLRNDGWWTIVDVDYWVDVVYVEDNHNNKIRDCFISPSHEGIPRLRPNDSSTILIDRAVSFPPGAIKNAEIYIGVEYRPAWFPVKFRLHRRFKSERKHNGAYTWLRYFSKK